MSAAPLVALGCYCLFDSVPSTGGLKVRDASILPQFFFFFFFAYVPHGLITSSILSKSAANLVSFFTFS